ncbi:hypothetical protein Tco_0871976 [Tanacetum coccineum]
MFRSKEISQKQDTMMALKNLNDKIEAGYASIEDRDSRIKLLHEIDKFDSFEAVDSIQKARIKWDVEGDENSKFFHSLINQKRRNNSINGIMHEALGWLLKEIHVTLAHLEKKWTRLQTYTNYLEENPNSGWRRRREFQATASGRLK